MNVNEMDARANRRNPEINLFFSAACQLSLLAAVAGLFEMKIRRRMERSRETRSPVTRHEMSSSLTASWISEGLI